MKHSVSIGASVVQLMEMPNGGASDARLKKGVSELEKSLERILALRPVTWYWKTDVGNDQPQYGFIAQEVEDVFPDLVTLKSGNNGTQHKYLLTKALLPYLVKAFEEQQQQIDALQLKLEECERQIREQ